MRHFIKKHGKKIAIFLIVTTLTLGTWGLWKHFKRDKGSD